MKNKKITIFIIVLVTVTVFYYGYSEYASFVKNSKAEKEELISRQQELEDLLKQQNDKLLEKEDKTAELLSKQEKLIETVADDVKSQSSAEIQHLKTEVSSLKTQNETQSDEIENFKNNIEENDDELNSAGGYDGYDFDEQSWGVMSSVARVECYTNDDVLYSTGAGSVWIINNNYYLLTNEHVISDEYYGLSCLITIPLEWNNITDDIAQAYENDDLLVYLLSEEYTYWEQEGFDLAVVEILEGEQSFELLEDYGSALAPNTDECNETVAVGEKVIIIGYPYTGAEYIPTVTEGIISSFENIGDTRYYVTSAKIEAGNSGGLAVTDDYYCTVGIPTASYVGGTESLGRILLLTEDYIDDLFDDI